MPSKYCLTYNIYSKMYGKKMEIIGGVLQQESTDLMKNVKNWVLSE